MIYIFDIDGTLTPSRNPMDSKFKEWFTDWSSNKRVWMVTGSDRSKSLEQLGELLNTFERVYQCAGNAVYKKGKLVYKNDYTMSKEVKVYLDKVLKESKYPIKTGKHFEYRQGSANFSTIGRNCTQEQRDEYYSWDRKNKEREKIVKDFNEIFQDVTIAVGGQISLDVMPVNRDKGQILNDITSPFTFFGDHLFPGGNDFPILKKALEEKKFNDNKFYHVDNWQHTWEILKLIHLT